MVVRWLDPLESPAVAGDAFAGGAFAVPGSDTARQDALNCASVRVLHAKPNVFSLLRVQEQWWTS